MIIRDVVDLPCSHIYCERCLEHHEDKICPREDRDETFVISYLFGHSSILFCLFYLFILF